MDSNSKSVGIVSNQWISACQLPSYQRHVHTLFEEMIHKRWGHGHWHPAIDVVETNEEFVVEVDLPGVEPEHVTVTTEEGKLTVEGERKSSKKDLCPICLHTMERPTGRFYCSVDFPGTIEYARATKDHRNGVLTIRIPKKNNKGQL